ncbi:hypothetical protein BDW75DRAFT_207534 [Aspergillus navahoensis]
MPGSVFTSAAGPLEAFWVALPLNESSSRGDAMFLSDVSAFLFLGILYELLGAIWKDLRLGDIPRLQTNHSTPPSGPPTANVTDTVSGLLFHSPTLAAAAVGSGNNSRARPRIGVGI